MTFDAPDLSAQPPRAIIFDIGRVIVQLNLERAFAPLVSTVFTANGTGAKLSAGQIWRDIQAHPHWCDRQEGRIPARFNRWEITRENQGKTGG